MGKKTLLWIVVGYAIGSFLPLGALFGAFRSKAA